MLGGRLLFLQFIHSLLLFRSGQLHGRRRQKRVSIHSLLGNVVEDRKKLIELLLPDGVEFVVVADRATHGQTQPDRGSGFHPVHRVTRLKLLVNRSAFAGADVAAIEPRSDQLIPRGMRQEIAGQLVDGELVERKVLIERLHHPVAIRPNRPFVVQMQPVRIAVARRIEPVARHLLAVARRLQKTVHDAFVGSGLLIGEEIIDFLERRGQARQVKCDATNQGRLRRLRGRAESLCFQSGQDEAIHVVARPIGMLGSGRRRTTGRNERPMRLVGGALLDPLAEQGDLVCREFAGRIRRWHMHVWIRRIDPAPQLALFEHARLDGLMPFDHVRRALGNVEAQAGFALVVVETVTGKTVLREDGPNILVEANGVRLLQRTRRCWRGSRVREVRSPATECEPHPRRHRCGGEPEIGMPGLLYRRAFHG